MKDFKITLFYRNLKNHQRLDAGKNLSFEKSNDDDTKLILFWTKNWGKGRYTWKKIFHRYPFLLIQIIPYTIRSVRQSDITAEQS